VVGGGLVAAFALSALLAPWLSPYDPAAVPSALTQGMLRAPSPSHPFGTDALGRDLLSRVLHGGRVSLALGLGVEVVAGAIGLGIGLLAGYYGGWRDSALMRMTDVVMAFPSLILAIGLIAVFERPGLDKVAVVLTALGWTTIARVVRGETLSLKERDHVQAARALGVGHGAILFRHILPNALGPVIVTATIGVGSNMIAEAGLSFLGLGVAPPAPSWGAMINEGRHFLFLAPHIAAVPGVAIMAAVMAFNFIGDGLRDAMDVREEIR
jgi:ABC-type dipeptide/oligopeptide/nickel transport system permease subunit